MGLDIYINRISKPEIEDKVYLSSEIDTLNLSYIPVCRAEEEVNLFQDMLPYTIQRMVTSEYINLEKLIADYNLPQNAYIGMMCGTGITVCGRDESNNYLSQNVTREEIEATYTVTKTELSYVWAQEEIAYWRKAFDVQAFFYHTLHHRVVNTGYHLLNGVDIQKFAAKFEKTDDARCLPIENPTEDSGLFYHEWY